MQRPLRPIRCYDSPCPRSGFSILSRERLPFALLLSSPPDSPLRDFPGKPLADIAGRPMIEHVYRRAADARGIDAVVVATDDARIAAAVERFGGIVRLTQTGHRTGTDRIAEIASELSCEILVNVQGDLPLIEPGMISEVLEPLTADRVGADVDAAPGDERPFRDRKPARREGGRGRSRRRALFLAVADSVRRDAGRGR